MDDLQKIFTKQKENDSFWWDKNKFTNDRNYRLEVVKEFVLGIYDQTTKLMSAFDYQKHTLQAVEDYDNAIIQLIDINKYTIGLLSLLGLESHEYLEKFIIKSNLLSERWNSLKDKMTKDTKVIVWDIDGVIADYDTSYREFLENEENGLKIINDDRSSYSYYNQYGIDKLEEENLHAKFIKAGGFLNLKVYPEMVELIELVYGTNVKVVLLTARPSWVFKRLIPDTYEWLKDNGIKYDLLLWDKDKAETLVKYVFPADVLYFIEDRDKHALEISHLGVDVLLIDKSYNRSMPDSEHITRVSSTKEIEKLLLNKITGK